MKILLKIFVALSLAACSNLLLTSCDKSDEPGDNTIPKQSEITSIPTADMAVDLGLSVKWAPFNVGATKPTDYGNYYAWGEVEPKNSYTLDNYMLDYFWGAPDVFGTQMDVAHVKWGTKWRIPTIEETLELVKNCKWEEVEIEGVKGMRVTGPTGNYIFLPAAGRCVEYGIEDKGTMGHYWQGTATASGEDEMYYYDLNQITWGLSIRPVWAN